MRLITLLLFVSCAKISYMTEQGIGQVALEWNGTSNEKVLRDPEVSKEHKRKIKLIEKAKKYFYNYFGLEPNSIYAQTTFLDQEAVSYLVIHSKKDRIKAEKSCFPIAGCFPYQGFFSKYSALEFKDQKEDEGFATYMRPVFAYSTLNHPLIPFSDNILSSFFHYKDEQLVHLIFHELVHTILFVKNETQFNENLAEFVSDTMMIDYLGLEEDYVEKQLSVKRINRQISKGIVEMAKKLNNQYKVKKNKPEYVLNNFLRNEFRPKMKEICKKYNFRSCWPLKQEWNNARFGAFSTYAGKQDEILQIYKEFNIPLKDFIFRLIHLDDKFDHNMSFINFIKQEGKS